MAKRRSFTCDFKQSILQELEHKPLSEVCREHELVPTVVARWKREQRDYPFDAFKGRGNMYKAEAKIAEYERLVGQLYAEISLLKKSNAVLLQKRAEERRRRCSQ